jgi:hypothetical protein
MLPPRMGQSKSSALSCALLFALCGCGAPKDDPCGEPDYVGGATDEAWRSLVDASGRVVVDGTKGVTVTTPTEGQQLDAGQAAQFAWTSPLALLAPPARAPFPRQRSLLAWLSDLLVSQAYAHGTPLTGDGHLLTFTIPHRTCPLRVLTTELSWQADSAARAALKEAQGETVSLEVTSAYFSANRITEGPYRPVAPRTFKP